MKITWRTRPQRLLLHACFMLSGLLFGCGHPVPGETVSCGGEYAKDGRLTGSGATTRLLSNDFGPEECRVMDKGYGGSAALRAFRGGPGPVYRVADLRTGEFFRLRAVRLAGTQGRLRVAVREGGRLRLDLRQSVGEPLADGNEALALECIVPEELAGLTLEVSLEAGPDDSISLFEDLSVEVLSRSLVPPATRHSFWVDARDGHRYGLVHLGQCWWLAEDFAFRADSGQHGYTYAEALAALPPALRLPTDAEWAALEAAVGLHPVASGGPPAHAHQTRLRKGGDTGWDAWPLEAIDGDSLAVRYWSGSAADSGQHWIRHFGANIQIDRLQIPDSQRVQVRAIWTGEKSQKQ